MVPGSSTSIFSNPKSPSSPSSLYLLSTSYLPPLRRPEPAAAASPEPAQPPAQNRRQPPAKNRRSPQPRTGGAATSPPDHLADSTSAAPSPPVHLADSTQRPEPGGMCLLSASSMRWFWARVAVCMARSCHTARVDPATTKLGARSCP